MKFFNWIFFKFWNIYLIQQLLFSWWHARLLVNFNFNRRHWIGYLQQKTESLAIQLPFRLVARCWRQNINLYWSL